MPGSGSALRHCLILLILSHNRDAPVGRVLRRIWHFEPLIREPAHLGDLVVPQTHGLHKAAGGIRAIGGQFPVGVCGPGSERTGVCVPFDGDLVRQLAKFAGDSR